MYTRCELLLAAVLCAFGVQSAGRADGGLKITLKLDGDRVSAPRSEDFPFLIELENRGGEPVPYRRGPGLLLEGMQVRLESTNGRRYVVAEPSGCSGFWICGWLVGNSRLDEGGKLPPGKTHHIITGIFRVFQADEHWRPAEWEDENAPFRLPEVKVLPPGHYDVWVRYDTALPSYVWVAGHLVEKPGESGAVYTSNRVRLTVLPGAPEELPQSIDPNPEMWRLEPGPLQNPRLGEQSAWLTAHKGSFLVDAQALASYGVSTSSDGERLVLRRVGRRVVLPLPRFGSFGTASRRLAIRGEDQTGYYYYVYLDVVQELGLKIVRKPHTHHPSARGGTVVLEPAR